MRILRRPSQYTALACLVLIGIPIFWLNLWIFQKGAIGKFLRPDGVWWVAAEAVLVLVALRWLLKVKRRGLWLVVALSAALLAGNVYFLVTTKNYALAFYALFLLILSALYFAHLYRHLGEAYYHSGQRWYEGSPRFLPRLEAALTAEGSSIPVRLSRLAVEGCFAFADEPSLSLLDAPDLIRLKLGDLELDCAVELISSSNNGLGRGLRFIRSSPDQDKDIRDFIDRVRSAGYVS